MSKGPTKLWVFSDVHLHEYREFAEMVPLGREGPLVNSRLKEGVDSLYWAAEYVSKQLRHFEGANAVLCLGDIFHCKRQASTVVLQLARQAFREFSTTIAVMPGNHDVFDHAGVWHLTDALHSDLVQVMEDAGTMNVGCVRVQMIPYRRDKDEMRSLVAAATGRTEGATFNVLCLHCVLNEAYAGQGKRSLPASLTLSPEELAPFDLILVGDVHKRQQHGNIHYVGALLNHNFGDVGDEWQRGITEYTFEKGQPMGVQFTPNPCSPAFLQRCIATPQDLEDLEVDLAIDEATLHGQHLYIELKVTDRTLWPEALRWSEQQAKITTAVVRVRPSCELRRTLVVRDASLTPSMQPGPVISRWVELKKPASTTDEQVLLNEGLSILNAVNK